MVEGDCDYKLYISHIMEEVSNQHSKPMPVIGLYIAASSLVCFLLMLCDVIHGIRKKKLWFPCRFFSLNSLTLILLSVAAKIPVDLTTNMPSGPDQLSKVTGTAFICVSTAFFMPSVGASKPSECLTNMIALTIFVVTVTVNIPIQMSNNVISKNLSPVNLMMILCMFTLLVLLWVSAWKINIRKDIFKDRNEALFTTGKGSMLLRLELGYIHGYNSNPQFVSCTSWTSHVVDFVASLCALSFFMAILLVRVLGHDDYYYSSLYTHSDYKWSIKIILVTQILVIILGVFTTCIRWKVTIDEIKWKSISKHRRSIMMMVVFCCGFFIVIVFLGVLTLGLRGSLLLALFIPLLLICMVIGTMCMACLKPKKELEDIGEYIDLLRANEVALEEWILRKAINDMKRWMTTDSPNHLIHLLSHRPPSQQSLEQLNNQFGFREGAEASCLHLVFLTKFASVCTSSAHNDPLTKILQEVFEIIHFVDTKMNSLMFKTRRRFELARSLWMGNGFNVVLPQIAMANRFRIRLPGTLMGPINEPCQSQPDLHRALEIIRQMEDLLPSCLKWDDVCNIMNLINARYYQTVEELYGYMEQLFVDILHIFLIQLPDAIFKEVMECPVEECEERIGVMLKFLCKIKSLEGSVEWSFPVRSNITRLISDDTSMENNVSDVGAIHVVIEDANQQVDAIIPSE